MPPLPQWPTRWASADSAAATDAINELQVERVVGGLVRSLLPGGTVGILRLSYKPYTAVIDASQGVAIAAALAEAGYSVIVSDPQAAPAAQAVLGSLVEVAAVEPCAARCGIRIITTPWPQYKDLPLAALQRAGGRLIVVDCWRLLLPAAVGEAVDLVYLGQGADQQAAMDETSGRADIVTQVRRRARRRPRPVRPNQACLRIGSGDRIVVTGGGGLIGGCLVRQLIEQGFRRVRAADLKPLRLRPAAGGCLPLRLS